MTLGISMLKHIFSLHTKTKNQHLKYPNVLYYNINICHLKKTTYVNE